MGDQHRRNAALGDGAKHQRAHALAQRRVQLGKGLVEHQGQRLCQQCARQGHPGALAAGQSGRVGVGKVLQFDFGQCRVRLCQAGRFGACGHCKQQVFQHVQVGKQQIVLQQQPHPAPVRGQGVNALAAQVHRALKAQRGVQRAAHGGQKAGLARATGAHDGVHRACGHGQRKVSHQCGAGRVQAAHVQLQESRGVVGGHGPVHAT